MNTGWIAGALVLALSAACAVFAQTPSQACGITATEVFHLRGECIALGEGIGDWRQEIENSSARTSGKTVMVGQISRYDLQANRCYVQTESWSSGTPGSYITLYDGQSRSILADYGNVNSKESGAIYPVRVGGEYTGHTAYLKAKAFIDERMSEK